MFIESSFSESSGNSKIDTSGWFTEKDNGGTPEYDKMNVEGNGYRIEGEEGNPVRGLCPN